MATEKAQNRSADEAAKNFEFFWRAESCFSQFYPSEFTEGKITFKCAEQYMMYNKAGNPYQRRKSDLHMP